MTHNRSMPPGIIIPELAYADVRTAVDWLCRTFGFRERLRIGDHRAQLVLDGAAVIAGRSRNRLPTSPQPIGAAHGSTSPEQDA